MRQIIVLVAIAALAGCASSSSSASHPRSSGDVVASMNDELAHTLDTGNTPVGTTTVTSGTMPVPAAPTKDENVPPQNPPAAPTIPSSGN